jgi:hypothetical protein
MLNINNIYDGRGCFRLKYRYTAFKMINHEEFLEIMQRAVNKIIKQRGK